MIFTPQCLVSRYNLEKIERINITKKPVILPAFWNNMYNLVKNTKYSSRKQNRTRLRVDVLLTSCSLGRNRGKHRDSREIKTKTSFTRVGTNSATGCSTFCTSPQEFLHSFSIGMAFLNLLSVAMNQSCYTESRLRYQ